METQPITDPLAAIRDAHAQAAAIAEAIRAVRETLPKHAVAERTILREVIMNAKWITERLADARALLKLS